MALSREETAQVLYQVGFRGEDLVKMVAIAGRESGWRPDAHRTDRPKSDLSGDRGLFQINYVHDNALIRAGIINSKSDLFDPVTNARAAYHLYKSSGLSPWTAGPGGWTAGGNPLYGTNVDAARAAVQRASSNGMIGGTYTGGGGTGAPNPRALGETPTGGGGVVELPPDTQVFVTNGFTPNENSYVWAVFDVGGGVKLAYDLMAGESNWKDYQATYVERNQWDQMGVTYAGDVGELISVKDVFGNFGEFWNSIMAQVMGPRNPARNDPEVLKVLAEFAARPDMGEAELQNKLEATTWFQSRTSGELAWNGMSEGEQAKRREEAAEDAVQTWFQYVGESISPDDPRIARYIEDLASGKLGIGAFSQIVREQATAVPESPWNRTVRNEQEEQRSRGIDIENTAQNVRQTLDRWGIDWTNREVMTWAKNIVEKTASDDDLLNTIKKQAQALYPWKDPELETRTAASPWLQTYERTMEKVGALSDRDIQKALSKGQPVWEFEQDLKKSDAWLTTKNAHSELTSLASDLGRKMGFV